MPREKPKPQKAPLVDDHAKEISDADIESLLQKCFEAKATSADVGRLYKAKDRLGMMNWDSSERLSLRESFVSCFECRIFYKSAQGVNFLALVYNLHPLMVAAISEVWRRCILSFPQAQVQTCSEVLLKAWMNSSGGVRMAIEQAITEWMRKALFTSTRVAERVRFLLSEIHLAVRSKEIDDLLSRFYGPILFRHTKVANWEVRFNAIALLCAAFPVMPPDRSAIEFEEKLTVQFRVLKDSMEDPNEAVRKCAVVGTGRILRDFWEVLTIEQIAMVLDCVSEKAGRDKKSMKTRSASIDAISLIVDNPLSHGVMAELLPSTKHLLNDEAPTVRLKYAEFLLKVSKFKTISIPNFIQQSTLFSRIATDHAQSLFFSHHPQRNLELRRIAVSLSSLVAPSLFASSVEEQVQKTLRMAEAIPQGLLALLANCAACTSELDRVRLSVALASSVFSSSSCSYSKQGLSMGIAKVVLRAATELMRSTRFASVQNTQEVFPSDSDEGKLCAFIYRHFPDRVDLISKQDISMAAEVTDWLSLLDATRLPLISSEVFGLFQHDPKLVSRLKSVWDPPVKAVLSREEIESALELDDLRSLKKVEGEMRAFVEKFTVKIPNFDSTEFELFKLCLCALLKLLISDPNELSTLMHRVSLSFIASLTRSTVQKPLPAAKRSKKQTNSSNVSLIEDLGKEFPSQMAELTRFYLSFLLLSCVLAHLPLKATKFDQLCQVYKSWIDRTSNTLAPSEWKGMQDLVRAAVETHPTLSFPTFPLIKICFELVSQNSPENSILEDLVKLALNSCGFSQEFATLVTKMSIENSNHRVLIQMKQRIADHADIQLAESVRAAISAA